MSINLCIIIALCISFFVQYGLDIQPCVLCTYQRYGYFFALILAYVSPILCSIVFFVIAGIAGFHVGSILNLWGNVVACDVIINTASSIDVLKTSLMASNITTCATDITSLILASGNVLFATGLGLYSVSGILKKFF
ncbi:MAG: disulfide bond formation protein B [Mycoplasmataceae bacterium]|jgi:disulfide bond formation protein DsbB|nr:disulfide bond formation protein B [Mycoplasmataceae bacterium]